MLTRLLDKLISRRFNHLAHPPGAFEEILFDYKDFLSFQNVLAQNSKPKISRMQEISI